MVRVLSGIAPAQYRDVVTTLTLAAVCSVQPAEAAVPFTVVDDIGMSEFVRLDGQSEQEVKFSSDGRYFAVITKRGIVERNQVEDTLRVFSSAAVQESVRKFVTPPAARLLLTVAASEEPAIDR